MPVKVYTILYCSCYNSRHGRCNQKEHHTHGYYNARARTPSSTSTPRLIFNLSGSDSGLLLYNDILYATNILASLQVNIHHRYWRESIERFLLPYSSRFRTLEDCLRCTPLHGTLRLAPVYPYYVLYILALKVV